MSFVAYFVKRSADINGAVLNARVDNFRDGRCEVWITELEGEHIPQ